MVVGCTPAVVLNTDVHLLIGTRDVIDSADLERFVRVGGCVAGVGVGASARRSSGDTTDVCESQARLICRRQSVRGSRASRLNGIGDKRQYCWRRSCRV